MTDNPPVLGRNLLDDASACGASRRVVACRFRRWSRGQDLLRRPLRDRLLAALLRARLAMILVLLKDRLQWLVKQAVVSCTAGSASAEGAARWSRRALERMKHQLHFVRVWEVNLVKRRL